MNSTKNISACAALLFSLTCGFNAQALELLKKDDASLNLGGRFQLLALGQKVSDPARPDDRLFLFLNQARLILDGTLGDYRYYTEWAVGGEDEVKNQNSSLGLLDFRADVPINDHVFLRVGQFKVPFGREALIEDGSQFFSSRSLSFAGSRLGRDVGLAAVVQRKGVMGTIGVFTGGGRDNPERYLPEDLGIPLVALRYGYDSSGTDPYRYKESGNFMGSENEFSAFLNLAYTKDSLVGHSTVLNVRPSEKSLLLNPNWNPYLGQSPNVKGHLYQASLDSSVRIPVGDFTGTGEFELTHAAYVNSYGNLHVNGARVVGSAALNPFELSLRYSVLFPSRQFQYKGSAITGSAPFQEVTPAVTFYHRPWSRVTLEVPLLINTPVANENGTGSYVLMEQQDQTTVIGGGKGNVGRQFVPEIRLFYQLTI
ncbi:MAG: hypothetical protein H7222_03835 [Methylotenera sp.]|nr:hypothetical protein [Oligoflexia bacterium]